MYIRLIYIIDLDGRSPRWGRNTSDGVILDGSDPIRENSHPTKLKCAHLGTSDGDTRSPECPHVGACKEHDALDFLTRRFVVDRWS